MILKIGYIKILLSMTDLKKFYLCWSKIFGDETADQSNSGNDQGSKHRR